MEHEGRLTGSSAFGILLRRRRLAAGLSQEALAERARMSSKGISALERGERRTPQRETLALLAGALALNEEQRQEFEVAAARSGLPRRLGPASVTVGPWADRTNSNLPFALKSFVGREEEVDKITALVREHRLVTLAGVGGSGKTETALQVGRALNDSAGTAVCFVALAPLSDPSLVVTAIASALGVQEVPNRPLPETLVTYLKSKTLLLILDNCEHVITHAAEVAETILSSCARVRILATSRESLRAAGEHSFRLPSLSAHEAVALFSDRARAADNRFELTDENIQIVAELCRRLDGIPLAIELAAARVNQLSPQALVEKLDDRFRILAHGERTARARQQTMGATIDWSYELLSAPERRVFERLSVFAGGCALAAATTVCGDEGVGEDDVLDLLSSLVDKSLVIVDLEGHDPRYRLIESFRQYAREKLAAHGEQDTIEHRHAVAYLELAKRLDQAFYDEQEVFFATVYLELDNWRATLHRALIDRGDILLGQRLTGELNAVWGNVAPVEGRRWLVRALETVDERTLASVLAKLSYTESTIANTLCEHELTLASSRTAAARYRALGDRLGIARALCREGHALSEMGRVAETRLVLKEALSLARSVGNRWLVAMIPTIGIIHEGDLVAARVKGAEALECAKALGATLTVAWTTITLSGIESRAGNAELALRYTTDALATFRAFNDTRGVACALNNTAEYLISLARYSEAETRACEALDVAREHRWDGQIANALQKFAAIAALRPQRTAEPGPSGIRAGARILGFVDARLTAIMGAGPRDLDQQPEYDRIIGALRSALSAEALARLMAEGAALTEEQAVAEALV